MDAEQEVISDLKFISMIKKNEKINTKFMYVQKDGLLTRISRTFINPDNRYNTLTFLQRTINNTFRILDAYDKNDLDHSKHLKYKKIIRDLMSARIGLQNIQETYETDLKFKCDVTTLIESIENNYSNVFKETNVKKESSRKKETSREGYGKKESSRKKETNNKKETNKRRIW